MPRRYLAASPKANGARRAPGEAGWRAESWCGEGASEIQPRQRRNDNPAAGLLPF